MSKYDGGPAFARPRSADPENFHKPETYHAQEGMSLRAHIATQAMQAMITKSSGQDSTGGKGGVPLIAKYAVEYADALIAALEAS